MPVQERNLTYDGWSSLAAGQDSGRDPSQIEKNQAHRLNNMVCRGGVGAETRPAFRDVDLVWTNRDMTYYDDGTFNTVANKEPDQPQSSGTLIPGRTYYIETYHPGDDFLNVGAASNAATIAFVATGVLPTLWTNGSVLFQVHIAVPEQSVNNFHDGVFQCASYYLPHGSPACIMATIGGRLYQIHPKTNRTLQIKEVELPYRGRNNITLGFMQQADKFHVTQDGEAKPIIFDGTIARRAKEREVPVGTHMAYGMGRLVVNVNKHELEIGDLYGSNDGADPGDAVIMFTETTFLNEGFRPAIAFALGQVTGLHFAPQQDSSVGDGELLAFSENGVSSFFLSQPRDQWKDSAFQRVTLLNIGARCHASIVSFNGDLWFRSDDGWRSYRQARAEIQGWAHLPLSNEVRPYMDADTEHLLIHGSAINFNNRLISTCTPRTNQGRPFHNGLLSLDFDVLSSFGQATKPAWDGHWDGPKILRLVAGKFDGVKRAFVFALDAAGKNQIYELNPNPGGDDFSGPIPWTLEMRSMDFASPYNEKEILGGDAWIDEVDSTVRILAEYKSDQEPDWQHWQAFPPISKIGACQEITCGGVPTIRQGYYPRRTMGKPPDGCNEATGRQNRRCFEFQAKLTGSGHCRIKRFRLTGQELAESGRAKDQCPAGFSPQAP